MKFARLLVLAASIFGAQAVPAQIAVPEMWWIGSALVWAKNGCVAQHPDMREELDTSFEGLVQRSLKVFPRELWRAIGEAPSVIGSRAYSRGECEKLVGELQGVDFGAIAARVTDQGVCMREVRVETERSGPTRPAIGVALMEGLEARIAEVDAGGPAAAADLRPGDLVVAYGSQPVSTPCELALAVLKSGSDVPVPVSVLRASGLLRLQVTPARTSNE